MNPIATLKHHVTGAIERGESVPILEMPAKNQYTPRRASLKRWLESAPSHILDCFDDGEDCNHADRFTVFFTGDAHLMTRDNLPRRYSNTIVPYLAMSERPSHPQGFGQHGELDAAQTAAYRYRNGKRRVRWLDLPEAVRNACL